MALALFVAFAAIYRASPERDLLDSKYALLTSQSLLLRHRYDVSPYLPGLSAAVRAELAERAARPGQPGVAEPEEVGSPDPDAFDEGELDRGAGRAGGRKLPWQLRAVGARLLYHYPAGTSLLSAPLLALALPFGATTLGADGLYSVLRERELQAWLAAFLAAAAVALGFFVARRELPVVPAVAVAAIAALGSGLWSVASRVLWTHTWGVLLLFAALLELLRWEDGERRRPELLGALLVAAFWVRPTNAFPAAALTLFVAWRHRAALPRLVAAGAAGFALYVAFSLAVFEAWFPTYMEHIVPHGRLEPGVAFVGQLISAEHGLLVHSPILFAVAALLAWRGVAPERRALAALALGLVVVYLLFYAWRARWWGAGAIGPRFLCDVTPFLVWLGAHAWRRAREAPPLTAPARWLGRGAVTALALASVAAHATGAFRMTPGEIGGVPRGERHEVLAPIGSAEYWRKLPQLETARWLGVLGQGAGNPAQDGARRRGGSPPGG